jgi:hypothetical protein
MIIDKILPLLSGVKRTGTDRYFLNIILAR